MEIWKDIKNYENCYQVSSYGNVRSLNRKIKKYSNIDKKIMDFSIKGKLLKFKIRNDGYKILNLSKNGISKEFYIHYLVANTFIGERPKDHHICHGDGNRQNNNLSNLRYGTRSDNTNDSIKHGTCYFKKGEDNPYSKLKKEEVKNILENKGIKTQKELSKQFGVCRQSISSIQTFKNWKHL